ncbi:MAG: tetratricopeptide repeat protein [Akkermansiaceae bacterium]
MKPNTPFIAIALASLSFVSCGEKNDTAQSSETKKTAAVSASSQLASQPGQNAISQRCMECHKDSHAHWHKSQHAQANRLTSDLLDGEPFTKQALNTPNEKWKFTHDSGTLTVQADDEKHTAEMAIGTDPLIQYLVAASGGRWQAPNAAWDPKKKEWFDVFNGDPRTKADWGHWTGRGMNWNAQCAWCHMTSYEKNYDIPTDSYQSHWKEMGIGCTQCHGGMADHADEKTGCLIDLAKHNSIKKNSPERIIDTCASCHSRRSEFDDQFVHGEKFGDHYQLQLPTQPHLYYPDGQIRDEDYVWTSLRLSNMGHKGVHCMDCHDPHTAQLKLPIQKNELCMSCHASGTNGRIQGATIIDPNTHSHHSSDNKGSSCVECHMSHTTYMGRDPRRDHGFHIPDPQLTKELGIPNACNKCHEDKDTEWAIKWTNTWFGDKMQAPERKRQRARTRAIASAYRGEGQAVNALLESYNTEPNPTWQASLLEILQPWGNDPRVQYLGRKGVHSKDSLVRAAACRLLEFSLGNDPWLKPMTQDPVKEVRMAASWALRRTLPPSDAARKELEKALKFSADQPAGTMRLAQLAADSKQLAEAEQWMKKALALDQTSAGTHEAYAILLGQMGKTQEALKELQTAEKLDPQNSRYPYLMALTYAELKQTDKTENLLRKVIKMDPRHDRARYNLGLLLAGQEKLNEAIIHIRDAERINPTIADYPYARATIHMRQGDKKQAFEACRTVLGIDRSHAGAMQLLRNMGNPNK